MRQRGRKPPAGKEDRTMAKALSYKELIDYAKAHYTKGGDGVYECWDERTYNEYVELFGPITKRKALEMFRIDREVTRDRMGW